jgi:hypothetical protein
VDVEVGLVAKKQQLSLRGYFTANQSLLWLNQLSLIPKLLFGNAYFQTLLGVAANKTSSLSRL